MHHAVIEAPRQRATWLARSWFAAAPMRSTSARGRAHCRPERPEPPGVRPTTRAIGRRTRPTSPGSLSLRRGRQRSSSKPAHGRFRKDTAPALLYQRNAYRARDFVKPLSSAMSRMLVAARPRSLKSFIAARRISRLARGSSWRM